MNKLFALQQLNRLWCAVHCSKHLSSSSGKRPPKKVIKDNTEKVIKKTNTIFSATKISRFHVFGNKQIKKLHGVLLPQILINFSGMGIPILDYYHYSSFPIIAGMLLLCHPVIVWTGCNRIIDLSFNRHKREVYVQTINEDVHTIPLDHCSLADNEFAAGDVKFHFYNLGNFNKRNVELFRKLKTNYSPSDEICSDFKLNRINGIISGSYWIYLVGSCLAICIIYFTVGYTDLVYWLKLAGDFSEKTFGFSLFNKVFGHLIIQKS